MRPTHPAWLAHDRAGQGPPLVLIHGLGSHRAVWRPVFDALTARHQVVALDLPGFGASPRWPGARSGPPDRLRATGAPSGADRVGGPAVPGSVAHLADRVAAFLTAADLAGAHVAGSSLGGGVALELGRRGVARSVTAFAPVGFWRQPGLHWCRLVLGAARAGGTVLGPGLPRLLATRAGRTVLCGAFYAHPGALPAADAIEAAAALAAAPGFAAASRALGGWRPPTAAHPGALPGMPVTVAWGTRDLVLPYRTQARRARMALPDARHVTLPGCGHLPFADDPAACAELLTARQ